jgi:hypothetical protein
MNKIAAFFLAAISLTAPLFAFADFNSSVQVGKQQAASLSQQQLDSINARTFSDAFVTAKIIGFDRSEIDQLKADVRDLKEQNARLQAQLNSRPTATVSAAPSSALIDRVTALETKMTSLQGTLGTIVTMLSSLLLKLQ